MTSCTKTAIVYNEHNKIMGLPPYYYRYRNCDTNLTSNTPANQYQKLKLIQNTVRVYGSLYTANLGPLTAYTAARGPQWVPGPNVQTPNGPTATFYNEGGTGVCWNQMSDRPIPSVQPMSIPTGYNTSMNRRHTSVTSSRPGCQTPGGVGCDIKHNSYDRYLNRLKGKGPLRRGVIPPNFGSPVPFNRAFPIYGGKTTKTNIVNGCYCPKQGYLQQNVQIYNNPLWQEDPSGNCNFMVGDSVYAIETGTNYYQKAIVILINNNIYTVQFNDGTTQEFTYEELKIYFPCNCDNINSSIFEKCLDSICV